jgi:hypothetical protein
VLGNHWNLKSAASGTPARNLRKDAPMTNAVPQGESYSDLLYFLGKKIASNRLRLNEATFFE